MLDVWSTESGKLRIVSPVNSTSDAFYPTLSLTRPASNGVYPASFTLWNIGAYTVRISNSGRDIQGSPATIYVVNAPVDPTASVATGDGLVGGVAGDPLTVYIQSRDTRQTSIQYLSMKASVVPYTAEVQKLFIGVSTGSSFTLTFRGSTSSSIVVGTTSLTTLSSYLSAMATLDSFTILYPSGPANMNDLVTYGTTLYIRFDGPDVVGSLPLLQSSASTVLIGKVVDGDAPFRRAVQVVTCPPTLSTVTLSLGSKSVSINTASATLATVASAMTSTFGVGVVSVYAPNTASSALFCRTSTASFVLLKIIMVLFQQWCQVLRQWLFLQVILMVL